jgi:hypothetical protein
MEEQFGVRIPRRSVTKMHLAPTSLKCMAFITAIQCPSFGKKKEGILPIQYLTNIQVPKSSQGNRSRKGKCWARCLILDHVLRLLC